MKPYIVRPVEPGRARLSDRKTGGLVGEILHVFKGWEALCVVASMPWLAEPTRLRADAAEALWRHYLDEHKEQ